VPYFDPSSDQQRQFNAFAPAPIPDPRDRVLDDFMASVVAGGPDEVRGRLASLSDAGRRVLRSHAERLASRAVREQSSDLLVAALVATVLGGLDQNAWEAMMPMALIDDASRRLGLEPADVFEQAAAIVGHPGSVNLMVWLTRSAEDRTPEAMGFAPATEAGGFRYAWSA
jgi:hypothetical protein